MAGVGPPPGGVGTTWEVCVSRHPNRARAFMLHDCVTQVASTYHQAVTYQPASRYWMFQWYETAIYVGAALAVLAFCFWWLRHRSS